MGYEEFKAEAIHAAEVMLGDGFVERVERLSENECYLYVLEGGYEPARLKAWLSDGHIMLGYR